MNIIKNDKLLKKKQIAGVILKPNDNSIKKVYQNIKKIFKKFHIKVILEYDSAININEKNGYTFKQLCKKSDFLVTLGGDGTLISVTRRSFKYQKAVMGINLGNLGFLTDIMPNELEKFLKNFMKDKYRIDHRMMIEATINNHHIVAFNDIVISRKDLIGMIELDGFIDNKIFNHYNGDGLIISTPTGSTAYNLSCNGPIVFPLTDAFIVTPISPHSLTQRPLVLPADFKISFKNTHKKDLMIIIDGHDTYNLKYKDTINIKIASSKAQLIHRVQRNYFEVLSNKLNWGTN